MRYASWAFLLQRPAFGAGVGFVAGFVSGFASGFVSVFGFASGAGSTVSTVRFVGRRYSFAVF